MKRFSLIAAVALILSACQKDLKISPVDFDVQTDKATFKVGDTVVFNFIGYPDNITFFSGETGHEYRYRERMKAEGSPQFSFSSFAQYGTQQNTMHVYASNTFDGTLNENIAAGGWTDITSQVVLSTGQDNTSSGDFDLKPFDNGNPLYIAFQFTGIENTSAQKTWTIKNFVVQNILDDGPVLDIANMGNAGWRAISLKNPDKVWQINADNLRFAGGPAGTPENDDWIVTRSLDLSKVSPDRGFPLKNITTKMESYPFTYEEPGEYVATFIATNAAGNKLESVIREVKITVVP